jgi:hypothetical protein
MDAISFEGMQLLAAVGAGARDKICDVLRSASVKIERACRESNSPYKVGNRLA